MFRLVNGYGDTIGTYSDRSQAERAKEHYISASIIGERQRPTNYRGFSIEHENDGTFSIFGVGGYISGGFKNPEAAKKQVNRWRNS